MNIPLKYTIQKRLPLIVTSSKPHLGFLVESGATHNILFSLVLEAYPNLFNTLNEIKSISGIDGTLKAGKNVNGTITIEREEIPVEFFVIDATSSISNIQG